MYARTALEGSRRESLSFSSSSLLLLIIIIVFLLHRLLHLLLLLLEVEDEDWGTEMETERLGRRGRRVVEDRVLGWGWGGMLILGV